jgi:hypothetical protein
VAEIIQFGKAPGGLETIASSGMRRAWFQLLALQPRRLGHADSLPENLRHDIGLELRPTEPETQYFYYPPTHWR